MRIKTLKIDGYKNLDAKLEHESDLITIIGNNGSGKSNLLEAISFVFKNLYNNDKNIPFDFYLEYETHGNKTIKIEKNKSKLSYYVDDEIRVSITDFLPKKVIAIYSGEEDRMWKECYRPSYLSYIGNIHKNLHANLPSMLYLNKYYWNIALLCLCLSKHNESFLKDVLGVSKIDKIKFQFSKSNYSNYKDNPALNFVKTIEEKSEYILYELSDLLDLSYNIDDIFSYLYIAFTPDRAKIIENITVMFNDGLTIEDLSEGQKKLLLIKAALEFAGQEDTIYLLDEPDAHVHVVNKEAIKNIFDPYKNNRQIIFTTHSPTLVNCIEDDSLYMLNNGKFVSKEKREKLDMLIGDSWNKHKMGAFLSSKKDIVLLVEGKHDKIHITNAFNVLKEKYPKLDFDVFSIGGEGKIKPLMIGLYEAEVFSDKTYIAIYDDDGAGQKSFKDGYNKDTSNLGYKSLHADKIEHDNFFAFLLPKPNGFTQDCTIENMFEAKKYEESYKEAVIQASDYFGNKSIANIHEDIICKSKNILAEKSKNFSEQDFINFKPLFDLIEKIRNRNDHNTEKSNQHSDIANNAKENPSITKSPIYSLNGRGISAKGYFVDEDTKKFVVCKDSEAKKEVVKSCQQAIIKIRETLLKQKILKPFGDKYIFSKDYTFNSVSTAGSVVRGRSTNGWTNWKDTNGKTIDELIRKSGKTTFRGENVGKVTPSKKPN